MEHQPTQETLKQKPSFESVTQLEDRKSVMVTAAEFFKGRWPETSRGVFPFIENDFLLEGTSVFIAKQDNKIIGTCTLSPFSSWFSSLPIEEQGLLQDKFPLGFNDFLYIGGLGVSRELEGTGLSQELLNRAESEAKNRGAYHLIADTAAEDEKYKIKTLQLVVSKFGYTIIDIGKKVFYPEPKDLEKIFVYKSMQSEPEHKTE